MYPAAPMSANFFDMEIILSFCKDAKFPLAEKEGAERKGKNPGFSGRDEF
jgi:hypothetical protein